MHVASSYTADRALRPVRAPRWLPTPARRRARAAVAAMREVTDEILQACRADPTRDAPLVQALIAATDPETGQPLSDDDICNDLLIFMLAGHDTTATALTYALWALGHHPDVQDRVAAEAAAIGDRELTPEDVPAARLHRSGAARGVAAVPAGRGGGPAGVARHRGRRLPGRGRQPAGGRDLWRCTGIRPCGRPARLRPRPVQPGELARAATAGISSRSPAGPRSCIGEHFARLETTLALATIIRSIEIRSLDDDFPVEVPFTTVRRGPHPGRVSVLTRVSQRTRCSNRARIPKSQWPPPLDQLTRRLSLAGMLARSQSARTCWSAPSAGPPNGRSPGRRFSP